MSRTPAIAGCLLMAVALCGCASSPRRTHRGDLLDDKVTALRVKAALERAEKDFGSIHVTANKGVVVLTGRVDSPQKRSEAERIARGVRRVAALEDRLTVGR